MVAIVAAVTATRQSAEAQVGATAQLGQAFTCGSEDPLGTAAAFKASLEMQKTAMKAYKTAVKNLIVGVKSAAIADADTTDTTESTDTTTEGGTTNE